MSRDSATRGPVRSRLWVWIAACGGAGFDWWSKGAAFAYHLRIQGHVAKDQPLSLLETSFFRLELVRVYNPGVAFGLLQDQDSTPTYLILVRAAAVAILAWLALRTPARDRLALLALATLIAGAAGNLADNLFHRAPDHEHTVRDFIHCTFGDWSFPAFNFADACISVGAIGYLGLLAYRSHVFRGPRPSPPGESESAGSPS